jgi:uncharacterized membrane protein YidH (DUF202 family)
VSDAPPPGWAGHDPDVLDSMANERNGLAWQRTALSWFASGAAVARYFSTSGLWTARMAIGWSMLLVGALVWLAGSHQYHRQVTNLRADLPTAVPVRRIRAVAFATTAVITAIVAIEIVYW